jgi:hypothetical protein
MTASCRAQTEVRYEESIVADIRILVLRFFQTGAIRPRCRLREVPAC